LHRCLKRGLVAVLVNVQLGAAEYVEVVGQLALNYQPLIAYASIVGMKSFFATATLAFALWVGIPATIAIAEDPDAILSKTDAAQMFGMNEAAWINNVKGIKAEAIGDYRIAPSGEYTLYLRPDPNSGLLVVSPSYRSADKSRPWKITVTTIADTPGAAEIYAAYSPTDVEGLLLTAMRELAPDFSVMGYLARNVRESPSINFSIFRKNEFPPIDSLNASGRVCPTENGRKSCVRASVIGAN